MIERIDKPKFKKIVITFSIITFILLCISTLLFIESQSWHATLVGPNGRYDITEEIRRIYFYDKFICFLIPLIIISISISLVYYIKLIKLTKNKLYIIGIILMSILLCIEILKGYYIIPTTLPTTDYYYNYKYICERSITDNYYNYYYKNYNECIDGIC